VDREEDKTTTTIEEEINEIISQAKTTRTIEEEINEIISQASRS